MCDAQRVALAWSGGLRRRWVGIAAVGLLAAASIPYALARWFDGEREHIDNWRPVDAIAVLSEAHMDLPSLDGSPLPADDLRPLFVARVDGVYLGRELLVPLPPVDVAATTGIDARYKRGSSKDLYVTPIGSAAQIALATQRRSADDGGPGCGRALLAVDVKMPERVVTEIMYTLGQSEFCRFFLVGRDKAGRFDSKESQSAPRAGLPVAETGGGAALIASSDATQTRALLADGGATRP